MSEFSTPSKRSGDSASADYSNETSSSCSNSAAPTSSVDAALASISVLTYNVWFAEIDMKIRYNEILRICSEGNADVICFQEVTLAFIKVLRAHKLKNDPSLHPSQYFNIDDYVCSDPDFNGATGNIRDYGVLMLVRKRLMPSFEFHNFRCSEMGRQLLLARMTIVLDKSNSSGGGSDISSDSSGAAEFISVEVGTVHLESLGYPQIRRKQLEICQSIMTGKNSILCGDFNFCSWRNYRSPHTPLENNVLGEVLPAYSDVWSELKPGEKGFTFDSKLNSVIEQEEQMRYDRIIYKSSTDESKTSAGPSMPNSFFDGVLNKKQREANERGAILMPVTISIIGTEPISTQSSTLIPSNTSYPSTSETSAVNTISSTYDAIGHSTHAPSQQANTAETAAATSGFASPPARQRPVLSIARSLVGRRVVNLFPSDHFGLMATFLVHASK